MWQIYVPFALVCFYFTYNRFLHPLAKVPGPFLASISPLWLVWQCMHQRRPRLDLQLHKRYGSVVRISPNEVIFSNAAYFKEVYGAGTKYTKSRFYEAPTDPSQPRDWNRLDMLSEYDTEKLRTQKRLVGPIYSVSNTKKHEALIDNNIRRWNRRLKDMTGQPFDMYTDLELLTVDTMSEMTFAEPYGAVEAGSDGNHMHTMWAMWRYWGWLGFLPSLNSVDKAIAPWALVFSKLRPDMPVFPFCANKLGEHLSSAAAGKAVPPCIFNDFRKLSHEKSEFRTNWGIRMSMTDIGAGVDTMSQTMAAVIAGVCQNKQVYEKLRAELQAAVDSGRIIKGQPVSYDEAAALKYFQACIYEAMRVWPNLAISLPRVVPAGGTTIDGYYIPQGYTVGMNSRQLGLSTDVFGPDTSSFRPERWLEASKEQRNDMETRNLSFGGPSRKCPGMHLAWVVVSKVLASLFLDFKISVLNELDGPPGPGGGKWIEEGTFPTHWFGWEVELEAN